MLQLRTPDGRMLALDPSTIDAVEESPPLTPEMKQNGYHINTIIWCGDKAHGVANDFHEVYEAWITMLSPHDDDAEAPTVEH